MKPNQVAESLPKSEALNLRATQGIVIDAASRFTTTKDRITDLLGPDETYGSPFHIDLELIEQ